MDVALTYFSNMCDLPGILLRSGPFLKEAIYKICLFTNCVNWVLKRHAKMVFLFMFR